MTKNRRLKVFFSGMYGVLGMAPSLAAFCRMTGANADYTSETGNEEQVRIATDVGEGFYLKAPYNHRGIGGQYDKWEKMESLVILEQRALEVAKSAIGGHNAPAIKLVFEHQEGWGKVWRVYIDNEVRGFWTRRGTSYTLLDQTGERFGSKARININDDGTYERETDSDTSFHIYLRGSWSEREALIYTYEAWCDGLLPSVADQKVRTERKEAKRRADHAKEEVLKKLGANYAILLKVIEQAAQQGIEGAETLIGDIAAGNERSAKWFASQDEED